MKTLSPDEIKRMSAAERLALIEDLWDSLDDAETPLPQAQRTELERRLETLDADIEEGVSWEQLKAELANRAR
jgi:putative addiction module component (TIGR02574 family)